MLGRLALKMKELADAELQYECHKNGNSALTNDFRQLRDNLEFEVVKLITEVDEKSKRCKKQAEIFSLIYSNKNSKETTDERK